MISSNRSALQPKEFGVRKRANGRDADTAHEKGTRATREQLSTCPRVSFVDAALREIRRQIHGEMETRCVSRQASRGDRCVLFSSGSLGVVESVNTTIKGVLP
jgi:hypothetical protein